MNEKENAVILRSKKYQVFTQKGFKNVCKKCDFGHVLWCWEFCDIFVDCFRKRNDNVPYFKEIGTDEEEYALILDGKKHRVIKLEESRNDCDDCSLFYTEPCRMFCRSFEEYLGEGKVCYVYFEGVKQ